MSKYLLILITGFLLAQDHGLQAYQKGDYDEARNYYESIINEKDEDATAQFGLGTTALKQQDIQTAMDAFKKALVSENIGLRSKAYYNMANALVSQQMNEEALSFYRKALELNPSDKDAKHNYEMLRYQQQQHQEQQESEPQDSNKEQGQQQNQDQQEQQVGDKQEEGQEQQQQAQEDPEKQQDLQHAQAILDALKRDEKVYQKRQMVNARSKKLEKDW